MVYIVLSRRDNEQSDLIHKINLDKRLLETPEYQYASLIYYLSPEPHLIYNSSALLKSFITRVLIRWHNFERTYAERLNALTIFQGDLGRTLWKDLHSRVVEHVPERPQHVPMRTTANFHLQNIGVLAEYYQRIHSKRVAELLDLSESETEKYISEMVSSGSIWAKIDRPKGIVTFRKRVEPNDELNNWSSNINELLSLLEKVDNHLPLFLSLCLCADAPHHT